MIASYHDHTFDPDLIRPDEWVLDAGCRGFDISKMMARRGANVIAMDADPNPDVLNFLSDIAPVSRGLIRAYIGTALVGSHGCTGKAMLDTSANPYAFSLHTPGPQIEVKAKHLSQVLDEHGISQLALLKLDIEGSEYGVMDDVIRLGVEHGPVAKQVTVEFHGHCGIMPPHGQLWFDQLDARMAEAGYDCVHKPYGRHEMDSLFVLRV